MRFSARHQYRLLCPLDDSILLEPELKNGVWAILLPFAYSSGASISLRHLAPLVFVLSVLVTVAAGLALPACLWVSAGIVGLYCIVNLAASLHVARENPLLLCGGLDAFRFSDSACRIWVGFRVGLVRLCSRKRFGESCSAPCRGMVLGLVDLTEDAGVTEDYRVRGNRFLKDGDDLPDENRGESLDEEIPRGGNGRIETVLPAEPTLRAWNCELSFWTPPRIAVRFAFWTRPYIPDTATVSPVDQEKIAGRFRDPEHLLAISAVVSSSRNWMNIVDSITVEGIGVELRVTHRPDEAR